MGVARLPQVRLAKGILCAGLHLYFNAYFPVDALESAWFPRMSFLQRREFAGRCACAVMITHDGLFWWLDMDQVYGAVNRDTEPRSCRVAFIYAVCITYRLRYYFAWAVSESSLIFSGLSFYGYDDSTGRAR